MIPDDATSACVQVGADDGPPHAAAAQRVCVIIAAFNANATIARAIRSALQQAEVSEVIVVDDASSDNTVDVTRACDDGTGRLCVIPLADNGGPSRARNIAIARSSAPLIAILDSDDFFLPGRFAALLAEQDWDIVADNIAFVREDEADEVSLDGISAMHVAPRTITTAEFVVGCITRPDRHKGELGFLKPVMRRAFLDRFALRYAERMRLAEDYELYARAMLHGARFRVASGCYYVAIERRGSLSDWHEAADLAHLEEADRALLALASADHETVCALRQHLAQSRRKHRHRVVLDRKREIGSLAAIFNEAKRPNDLRRVLIDILRDKLRTATGRASVPSAPSPRENVRYLFLR